MRHNPLGYLQTATGLPRQARGTLLSWRVTYHPVVTTLPTTTARQPVLFLAALGALALTAVAQPPASGPPLATQLPPPYWAYSVDPPNAAGKPTGNTPRHVPGSSLTFTDSQIADLFGVPDWHPDAHPKMPEVVANGRKPDVPACAYCHLPNGQGRPENASLAGLAKEYITQQMSALKTGARKSSEPKLVPVNYMITLSAHASDAEVGSAADYFSKLKPRPWIRVVETATVPKTHIDGWMLAADEPAATEPIGQRIIETPENLERTELRDDTSSFIAYVPPGSLKRGKFLVEKGGDGVTMPCAPCHGGDLRGKTKDYVPSIAGRSPSYMVRQIYDLQMGSRGGAGTSLMQAPVMKLTMDDMIAMAAYLASLRP
jgi:cytochrome c553